MASILLTNVDSCDAQKEHFQWYAATPPDVHQVLLPRHSLLFCFVSTQDHLIVDGTLRLYVALHQWSRGSKYIYLAFKATMTTHKLIKKCSYRLNCLISDWFGPRPFSKIINKHNKMVVAVHLRERTKI